MLLRSIKSYPNLDNTYYKRQLKETLKRKKKKMKRMNMIAKNSHRVMEQMKKRKMKMKKRQKENH